MSLHNLNNATARLAAAWTVKEQCRNELEKAQDMALRAEANYAEALRVYKATLGEAVTQHRELLP